MTQLVYKIDLTRISGEGDFPCPRCGARIAPEDETEDVYSMLETSSENGTLTEVLIACNKCGSIIHIRGFERCDYLDVES